MFFFKHLKKDLIIKDVSKIKNIIVLARCEMSSSVRNGWSAALCSRLQCYRRSYCADQAGSGECPNTHRDLVATAASVDSRIVLRTRRPGTLCTITSYANLTCYPIAQAITWEAIYVKWSLVNPIYFKTMLLVYKILIDAPARFTI